jgi:hypothetical protein
MKKTLPGSAYSGRVPAKIDDDTGWVPPLQTLKIKMFWTDFTSSHRYRRDSGWEPVKFSSGFKYKKIRKKKSVQCFAGFFLIVVSYEILTPSPVKNPRKLKEKQHTNYPRLEEVTTAIEKNPGKDPPAIMFFCSVCTLIQSGNILSC